MAKYATTEATELCSKCMLSFAQYQGVHEMLISVGQIRIKCPRCKGHIKTLYMTQKLVKSILEITRPSKRKRKSVLQTARKARERRKATNTQMPQSNLPPLDDNF